MFSNLVRYSVIMIGVVLLASCASEKQDTEHTSETDIDVVLVHDVEPAESSALPGQTWQAGSVTFSFQRGNHVLVRGGHLTETMPTGAPGRYSLESDILEVEVLGRIYDGTWDRETLTLSGHRATYLGLTETIYPDSVLDYPQQPKEETSDAKENS